MTIILWAEDLADYIDLRIERKVFGKYKDAKIMIREKDKPL